MSKQFTILYAVGLILSFFAGIISSNSTSSAQADSKKKQAPVRRVSTSVYYQVTYKNKSVRDLSLPPKTNKDIISVTKIVTFRSSLPGYETVSTGNTHIQDLNPVRTVSTSLIWNGKSWSPAVRLPEPTDKSSTLAVGQIKKLAQNLVDLGAKIDAIDNQLNDFANPNAPDNLRKLAANVKTLKNSALQNLVTLINGKSAGAQKCANYKIPPILRSNIYFTGLGLGYLRICPNCSSVLPFGSASIQIQQPNPDYDQGPRVKIREKN